MRSKIYFASDLHLGFPEYESSLKREKKFVRWLDFIKKDAEKVFLLGDVFDFWFDYKNAIPKGYVRLLGKIAELSDEGVGIHYFTGNHDIWLFGYFEKELGVHLHRDPFCFEAYGRKFYLAHGDGLGPGDKSYKFLKKIFTNSFCQWLFKWVHPDIGVPIARYWSVKSREHSEIKSYLGEEKEWLILHSKEILSKQHFDFFIYGHRHLPLDVAIGENSRYINLGDWTDHYTYGEFSDGRFELKKFEV